MNYLARVKQQVLRVAPSDMEALHAFQREVFGANALQLDQRHVQWLFEQNPYSDVHAPQIWIFKKDGRVYGQQAGIPFTLQVRGQPYRASWAVDLRVTPEYQLRGIGAVLNEVYVQTNDVTVGIGISDAAYKTFRRAGWHDLGRISLYARPMNAAGILAGFRSTGVLARIGAAIALQAIRMFDAGWGLYARARGVTLEHIGSFDGRVDKAWEEIKVHYPAIAQRDYRSLHWRFDAIPSPERYQRFYLRKGKRLCGYAVVRHGVRNTRPVAAIVDFLCPPELVAQLIARCLHICRDAGATAVYCTSSNFVSIIRALRFLGFVRRDSSTRFMVRFNEEKVQRGEVLSKPSNWFITMADSDGDWLFLRTGR